MMIPFWAAACIGVIESFSLRCPTEHAFQCPVHRLFTGHVFSHELLKSTSGIAGIIFRKDINLELLKMAGSIRNQIRLNAFRRHLSFLRFSFYNKNLPDKGDTEAEWFKGKRDIGPDWVWLFIMKVDTQKAWEDAREFYENIRNDDDIKCKPRKGKGRRYHTLIYGTPDWMRFNVARNFYEKFNDAFLYGRNVEKGYFRGNLMHLIEFIQHWTRGAAEDSQHRICRPSAAALGYFIEFSDLKFRTNPSARSLMEDIEEFGWDIPEMEVADEKELRKPREFVGDMHLIGQANYEKLEKLIEKWTSLSPRLHLPVLCTRRTF